MHCDEPTVPATCPTPESVPQPTLPSATTPVEPLKLRPHLLYAGPDTSEPAGSDPSTADTQQLRRSMRVKGPSEWIKDYI